MLKATPLLAPFAYDTDAVSLAHGLECLDDSLAIQSERDEADINTIVRRFGLTGQLPEVRMPQYGDYTGVRDYHSAMNVVAEAKASFMELPAEIRARFHNDPEELLIFCSDDKNRAEAEKLGIVVPKAVEPAPVVPAAPVVETPKAS